MTMKCQGELRASKGSLIFIPDGTTHFLRVESSVQLPEGFRSGSMRTTLRQNAELVRAAGRRGDGVEPEHGVPEELCGTVLEQRDGEVVLDVGFPIHVRLPDGEASGKRLYVMLQPPLVADEAELL
ncbi:MAG: hypothetical protein ABIJ09_13070 [Pseudomonadota bacterium]